MTLAFAGFLAGFVHVLSGPDHLAAVAPSLARGDCSRNPAGIKRPGKETSHDTVQGSSGVGRLRPSRGRAARLRCGNGGGVLSRSVVMARVVILGAGGSLGRHVLRRALAAGHEVTAFVREASQLPPDARARVSGGPDLAEPRSVRALERPRLDAALVVLHLTGTRAVNGKYERLGHVSVSLDDIRRFRQIDSRTPAHPEYRWVSGLETTTGARSVRNRRRRARRREVARAAFASAGTRHDGCTAQVHGPLDLRLLR